MIKQKPQLMAILNLTPDSFSDGGLYFKESKKSVNTSSKLLGLTLRRVEEIIAEGADVIDLGGESTRPGAAAVSEQEEMDRVLPAFEAIKERFNIAVSVDTSNAALMREAIAGDVDIINDVRSLSKIDNIDFLAQAPCKICLMHMQGNPKTMQNSPEYQDVNSEVLGFLGGRIQDCVDAGIERSRLIVDPGFGFGKTVAHNLAMLNRLQEFNSLECPILVGTSRKSMIGQTLNKALDDRLFGSIATVVLAVQKGAALIRVHDVQASRDAIDMTWAVLNEGLDSSEQI